jgi:hypothetical protein
MTFVFSLFFISHARALTCLNEAQKFLKEISEITLFKKHVSMHEFADCDRPTFGIDVIIHEAIHLEDLGVPAGLSRLEVETWFKNHTHKLKANFISLNNQHKGSLNLSESPSPKKLVMNFLKKHYLSILNDREHPIHDWLNMYILDTETLASTSFPNGLTELNAYIHGLRIENRVISGLSADNPYKNHLSQRHGLWHFLFVLKAYLMELKESYPRIWEELLREKNSQILNSLIKDSGNILSTTNHCNLTDEDEKKHFSLLEDSKYFEGLVGLLKNKNDLKQILCQ